MDFFVVIALIGIALLLAELLLPTGGILAVLGASALVAGGVIAITSDSGTVADIAGPALITLGILSAATFFVVGRKVLRAQRDEPIRGGREELVGAHAEVRKPIDPEGQVWIEGALWRARLAKGKEAALPGDRVKVEAIEGLTLVVGPEESPDAPAEKGAG